jgi:nicotinamidase-related amidase
MTDTSSAPWAGVITEEDERRYAAARFGGAGGVGQRPALLIIDVQYRTTGDTRKPFFESIQDYPTSCGETAWDAMERIAELLALFRAKGWPVLYPHVAPKESYDAGRLGAKMPSIMEIPERGYRFPDLVAPHEGDILIPKRHPSGFFATPLASYLVDLGVDTLVITGTTTSGCVRSTTIDAFSYNYRVVVPSDAVYDRGITSHKVNLFDMAMKYADVRPTSEVLTSLEGLPVRGDD